MAINTPKNKAEVIALLLKLRKRINPKANDADTVKAFESLTDAEAIEYYNIAMADPHIEAAAQLIKSFN